MHIHTFYHLMFQILALIPYDWKRTQLLLFASVRVILIPLFLLCALPRSTPILSGEGYPLLLSCLLGVTNGIVGSVPMTQAPSKVSEGHRELAGIHIFQVPLITIYNYNLFIFILCYCIFLGNIMTLSYTTGLTVGSLFAYILDTRFELPAQLKDVCQKALSPSIIPLNNTSAVTNVMSSTLSTLGNVTQKGTTVSSALLSFTSMFNTTFSTLATGMMEASTTTSPKLFVNVTT